MREARELSATSDDGVHLAITDHGGPADAPEVLFVHGFSQSRTCWARQYGSALIHDLQMVSWDLRGHGHSDKPAAAEAYRDPLLWAGDLAHVIEAAGLRAPILVAWSYGGRVAMDYLKAFGAARISGLVMVSATCSSNLAYHGPDTTLMRAMAAAEDPRSDLTASRAFVRACTSSAMSPDDEREILEATMQTPVSVRHALLGRPAAYEKIMRAFEKPARAIHGLDDRISLPAMSRYFAAQVPQAELDLYVGCGHMPQWERSERFNRDLARFAQSI